MYIHRMGVGASVSLPGATAHERGAAPTRGGGDTVTISDEARQRARAMGETGTEPGAPDYPLEAYSVPDWFVDLYGGYTTITARIGDSYEESRTGYERLGPADREAYDEYAGILQAAFREGLERIGVAGDTGAYYNDFVLNPANQATAREAITQRLQSDPRAMELMRHFGITL